MHHFAEVSDLQTDFVAAPQLSGRPLDRPDANQPPHFPSVCRPVFHTKPAHTTLQSNCAICHARCFCTGPHASNSTNDHTAACSLLKTLYMNRFWCNWPHCGLFIKANGATLPSLHACLQERYICTRWIGDAFEDAAAVCCV